MDITQPGNEYAGVVGTIHHWGLEAWAVYAAVGVLAVPLVGVISSLIVLGEPVGWREVLALILVTSAIFTVLILPRLRGKA